MKVAPYRILGWQRWEIELLLLSDILQTNLCIPRRKVATQTFNTWSSCLDSSRYEICSDNRLHVLHHFGCCCNAFLWGLCFHWSAVGFTPLAFVFPALAFTKAGKLPKKKGFSIFLQTLNLAIAILFSIVAVLGCTGAVRFIVEDIGTYKLFYNMQVFQRHKVVNV